MENSNKYKDYLYKVGIVFLVVLSLHVAVRTFGGFGKPHGFLGADDSRVITLSGHGEVQAVPDLANVYFSISKDAKTVKEAQEMVSVIEKAALEVLKTNGVEEKDIKTANASFNPKYETKAWMPCTQWSCPQNNPTIVGYTASESITVKVRNVDSVGTIMQGLGTTGVSDLSGPNFSIDDEDALNAEARKKAIEDAQTKAKALAKDLGVRLGDVVSFNESGFYPMPMYASKGGVMMDSAMEVSAPATLPKGENTITSDVTITYEIK